MSKYIPERFRAPLTHRISQVNHSTADLPLYLIEAVRHFSARGLRFAAALAYYAVFSIFPLLLLLIVVLSRILGPVLTEEQVILTLAPFLPDGATGALSLIQSFVSAAIEQTGSITLISVLALAWAGLGLFGNIASALDIIFNVRQPPGLVRGRLRALVMAVALILLLSLSFLSSFVIGLFDSLLLNPSAVWLRIATIALPLGLNMLIFTLLFRYVPNRRPDWEAIWPSALLGAVIWEVAKGLFSAITGSSMLYQPLFGTIASGMLLLLWVYILAGGFLFSAEICAHLNEWLREREWQAEEGGVLETYPLDSSHPETRREQLPPTH